MSLNNFSIQIAGFSASAAIDIVEYYPIIRITKQKTGKKVRQKILGNYYGDKLQYVDVDTYKVLVTDKGDPSFKMEFSVARDAYAVIPGNDTPKGKTMILSNMSYEPKDGAMNHYSGEYIPSYPPGHDTPAIKLYQRDSMVIHAEARPDALMIEPNGYRYKEDVASGIMLHVGGDYDHDDVKRPVVAGSEGCFGIVNDLNSSSNTSDQITKKMINAIWEKAKKGNYKKPNHIRIIIEKRDEKSIPDKIVFTKK